MLFDVCDMDVFCHLVCVTGMFVLFGMCDNDVHLLCVWQGYVLFYVTGMFMLMFVTRMFMFDVYGMHICVV